MLKRILCALLASLMLVGSLSACGETNEPADTASNSGNAQTDAAGSAESEAQTREPLEIPDTRYDDQTLTFLTRGDAGEWTTVEIYSAGMTSESDNINNAVYERNLRILETYGVTIQEIKEKPDLHTSRINNEIAGSTGDFQVVSTNASQAATLSGQGSLWNLNADALSSIDLEKSWWDRKMAEGLSINGRVFFATGDLMTLDNDATFCIFFNKQIIEDNRLEDPYTLVANNQWTMEKFYQMSDTATKEQDGKPGLSYDSDITGFAYTGDSYSAMMYGGGIKVCGKDADDMPSFTLDLERMQGVSEMGKRIFSKDHSILMTDFMSGSIGVVQVAQINFGGGYALFLGEVMQSVTRLRGFDVDFGILPYPMYDTYQDSYYSMMHGTASVVCIPKSVAGEELQMVAAMMEALAYHSVDTLTHQYYEINLKTRDSKDEKSGPMIDMILESRATDLAYYYQSGGIVSSLAATMSPTGGAVASSTKQFQMRLERDMNKLVDAMEKNSEQDE